MADFLNDGGWFDYSTVFLSLTENLFKYMELPERMPKLLQLYALQLYATSSFCNFVKATETYEKISQIITKCKKLKLFKELADVYCSMSIFHFVQNRYEEAYSSARDALNLLSSGLSKKSILNILRHTSKICVQKRCSSQAWLLITQALALGQSIPSLPMFSDILMDSGYYWLNSDDVDRGVTFYRRALNLRLQVYRSNNINIAISNEHLAYALYLQKYTSGDFSEAEKFSKSAFDDMKSILPENHYFQSSVKRVRALILEEIAIESESDVKRNKLLSIADDLHKSALKINIKLVGMKNLQTAKHYGNLGRLYQSMGKFEIAEQFQLKAIAIKEELLGPTNYEVGLSVGHLASLYTYHMKEYKKAEKLYLRSIAINIRLFGKTYSSLGYDYKGLIQVYKNTYNVEYEMFYHEKLREWELARSNIEIKFCKLEIMSPDRIIRSFAENRDNELSGKAETAN
ncbi:hypothetical protein D910_07498 [Dendroctonus ponderosae]